MKRTFFSENVHSSENVELFSGVDRIFAVCRQISRRRKVKTFDAFSRHLERLVLGRREVVDDAGNGRVKHGTPKVLAFKNK
jgi:hypothetical protein